MTDKFDDLINKFLELVHGNKAIVFEIIEDFCKRNKLEGPDGLPGLLGYVKRKCEEGSIPPEDSGAHKSLFEIAYMLWALKQLGRLDITEKNAKELQYGWDFGETRGYKDEKANYFRNLELQLHAGLRLLEAGYKFKTGEHGEPDYIFEEGLVVEVKAPASKKALLQAILKAVKQIEKSGKHGVIIVCLDHMVVRGMLSNQGNLPEHIVDIIASALPGKGSHTIGVIAEWVNWQQSDSIANIEVVQREDNSNSVNDKLVKQVWEALSNQDTNNLEIRKVVPIISFPYDQISPDRLDPKKDGETFFDQYF